MTPFSIGEIQRIRVALQFGGRIKRIAAAFSGAHTMDEVNEAYWAIKRFPNDRAAVDHVNAVLADQEQKVPLVNGRRAYVPRPLPRAMW